MSTYLPDYDYISDILEINRCRGIRPNGQTCHGFNHEGSYGDGFVHWRDRAPTRSGIRTFLTLEARRILDKTDPDWPVWKKYYEAQQLVSEWSIIIRVRYPATVTDKYRVELRAMLVNVDTWEEGREEAMTWATLR